ncbi:MAG: DUF6198 family protein [Clostridiales bacterium]|nr:DUF6198 family protein [Clostridiales bacterium]
MNKHEHAVSSQPGAAQADAAQPARYPLKYRAVRRSACYAAGLLLLALGVTLSVKSDLGVSPVSSLPYVLSGILRRDMGLVTALLFFVYVLAQIVLLKKEFHVTGLLQIAAGVLFGMFVSFTNSLFAFEIPDTYFLRLLFMLLSAALIGFSHVLVLTPGLAPQPPEGLMLAVQRKTRFKLHHIKIVFDCGSVALAALLSLVFLGRLTGVREGTALSALLVGVMLGFFQKLCGPALRRLLFDEKAAPPPAPQ